MASKSTPKTAHQIVSDYINLHQIDMTDFRGWFADAGYGQEEANVHDSRYFDHLTAFVEERDDGA